MFSPAQYNSLIQFYDAFPTDEVCRKHLENIRWNGKPRCPHCGHDDNAYELSSGKRYKCPSCRKKYSVLVGTIFENTKVGLRKWFLAIYFATSHKKGISSLQLSRDLNITQKSAWFMLHRIREMLREKAPELLEEKVEVDETYIGGKEKNKHVSKRQEGTQGRSTKTKTAVLGMVQRGDNHNVSKVRAQVVADAKSESLQNPIIKNVKPESRIISDDWRGYKGLEELYDRSIVKHNEEEYVVKESWGKAHTNNIECFWSHLKRGINGINHWVSEKHLQRYVDGYAFRFNTREMSEGERFDLSLTKCAGILTYSALTQAI